MRINSLRDANYIFEGQRLSLVASASLDTRAPQPAAEPVAAQTGGEQVQAAPPAAVAASVEIDDYSVANDGTVRVIGAETLGHYADWLGLSAARLRQLNQLRYGEPLLLGRRLRLDFSLVAREQFEQRRREYHTRLQADYFEERRITGTQVHIVRRGESLWLIAQRYADLPIWLLQQYNPDSDLGDLRAGMQLVVPRVENSEPSLTGATGPGSAETTR
jgi:membrane-bound lytic murein transglycosylase D